MIKRILCVVLGIFLLIFTANSSVSAEEIYGKVYCRNAFCKGKIALTFDDGPHPRYTKEILSILKEYQVTATFFIIGINAINYPEDLQRIVDAGCEIGNHTYSHRHLKALSEEEMKRELSECEVAISQICGIIPQVFRPPQGMMNESLKRVSAEMGYRLILWSIDTKDWALTPTAEILGIVQNQIRGGDIILMHDYVSGGNTTCAALRLLIPRLLFCGYEFVTVSELIEGDRE